MDADRFSLSFKAGTGILSSGEVRINDLCTVEGLQLLMPDVVFPLNLPEGVFGLRHRRHLLGRLDLTIYIDPLEDLLRVQLQPHDFYDLWRLSSEEGFLQILMVNNADETPVPFSFRLYPKSNGPGMEFTIEDIVSFGPLKSSLLGSAAGALEAITGVRADGFTIQLPGILREILFYTLPEKGWRLPDDSEVRLSNIAFFPDRIQLSFIHPQMMERPSLPIIEADKPQSRLLTEAEFRITETGDRLVTENQPDKARAIFARLLDRDPGSPFAAARIGMLDILDADRRESVSSMLDTARRHHPERLDLLAPLLQGAALYNEQDKEIRLLHTLSDLGVPLEQLAANIRLGEIHLNSAPKKAMAALEQALSIRREDTRALRILIKAAAKLKDQPRVERLIPRLIAAYPKGPKRAEAHVAAGQFYLDMAIPKEALAHFERAELFAPETDGPLFGMAEASRMMGDLDHAIRHLDRLERLLIEKGRDRAAADVLADLGEVWLEKGEMGLAILRFTASLELAPDHPERRLRLALLLNLSGRPAEAAQELERVMRSESAVKTAPWFGDAAVALAELYLFELSDPDAARHWARQAAAIDDKRQQALKLINRAIEKSQLETADNVSNLSPQQIRRLADDLILTERTEQALLVLEQGMIEFPENVELADRLITESRRAGDYRRLKFALSERIDSVVSKGRRAAMAEELGQLELNIFKNPASAICSFRDALEKKKSNIAEAGLKKALDILYEQANGLLEAGDFEAADTLFEVIQKDFDETDPLFLQLKEAEQALLNGKLQEAMDIAVSLKKTRREIRIRAAMVIAEVHRARGMKKEAIVVLEEAATPLSTEDATPLYLMAIDISPKHIEDRERVLTTLRLYQSNDKPDSDVDQAMIKLLAITKNKYALAEHLFNTRHTYKNPERLRRAARLYEEADKQARATRALEIVYRETETIEDLILLADALRKSERFDLLIGILEERRTTDARVEQMLKQELASYAIHLQHQSELTEDPPTRSDSSSTPPPVDGDRELLGKGGILEDDDDLDLNKRLSVAFDLARKKDEA